MHYEIRINGEVICESSNIGFINYDYRNMVAKGSAKDTFELMIVINGNPVTIVKQKGAIKDDKTRI